MKLVNLTIIILFPCCSKPDYTENTKDIFYIGIVSDSHLHMDPNYIDNLKFAGVGRIISNQPLDLVINHTTGGNVNDVALPWDDQASKYYGPNRKEVLMIELYKKSVRENYLLLYYIFILYHS